MSVLLSTLPSDLQLLIQELPSVAMVNPTYFPKEVSNLNALLVRGRFADCPPFLKVSFLASTTHPTAAQEERISSHQAN